MVEISQVEIKQDSIESTLCSTLIKAQLNLSWVKLEPLLANFSANAIILRRENSDNQIKPISITFFYFHQKKKKNPHICQQMIRKWDLFEKLILALLKFIESHYQHQ